MAVFVITGVSRGLGRAMASTLAERGHTIVGCGTSAEHVAALRAELGNDHHVDIVDVSSDDAVANWAETTVAAVGAPDFLVNNAAVITPNAPLWNVSAADFDRLTSVNINGVANTIRHFVPHMIKVGRGFIINFSSGWGRSVSADVAPYCASKWAIEGLTQALAAELPAGLAAVSLNPGIINTDMLQSCFRSGANGFPTAAAWAEAAVPFILKFTSKHNGQPVSVPGF